MQVHLSGNNVPVVKPLPNHTIPPSTAATFLATRLRAVLQPFGYSVFHSGDTPIQLSLPWWSCSYQYLNTKTSARGNRGFTTETLSISYNIHLYIRLVFASLIIDKDNLLLNSTSGVQQRHTKSVLTSTRTFSLSSEVVTIRQTDGAAHKLKLRLLQLKDLRVGQWEESCIGLTQENSIENSV